MVSKKNDLIVITFAAVLGYGYLAYGLVPPVVCHYYGKEATATVTKYTPRQDDEGNRIHDHVFSYDGHVAVLRFSKPYPVGHTRQMLYLPDSPSWVVSGSKQDSLWTVIDKSTNGYVLAFTVAVVLLITLQTVHMAKAAWRSRFVADKAEQPTNHAHSNQ